MQQERGLGTLGQQAISTFLGERGRQATAERLRTQEAQRIREAQARAAASVEAAAVAARRAKELKAVPPGQTEAQARRAEAQAEAAELTLAERQKFGGLTAKQQSDYLESDRKVKAAEAKEELAQKRDIADFESEILEAEDIEAVVPLMDFVNKNTENPHYWAIHTENKSRLIPGVTTERLRIPLPIWTDETGKRRQMTSKDVVRMIERGKARGVSEEQMLEMIMKGE